MLQRARWALGIDELNTLKKRAELFGLDKAKTFEEYRRKYLNAIYLMATDDKQICWPKKMNKISKESYRALMNYAREKNIALSGFKNFDGDINLIKEIIDDVESMIKLFPEINSRSPRLTISASKFLSDDTFAETSKRTINININAFRSKKDLIREYDRLAEMGFFVKGTNYRGIILHEI